MAINTILGTTYNWLTYFGGVTYRVDDPDGELSQHGIMTVPQGTLGAARLPAPLMSSILVSTPSKFKYSSDLTNFTKLVTEIFSLGQDVMVVFPCAHIIDDLTTWHPLITKYPFDQFIKPYVEEVLKVLAKLTVPIEGSTPLYPNRNIYFEFGNEIGQPRISMSRQLVRGLPINPHNTDYEVIPDIIELSILPVIWCLQNFKTQMNIPSNWGKMVLGSIGNGAYVEHFNWGKAVLDYVCQGTYLPSGTVKNSIFNKSFGSLISFLNTHYLWTAELYNGNTVVDWRTSVSRWETECATRNKDIIYSEEGGGKSLEVGLGAATIAKCLFRFLDYFRGSKSCWQRRLNFWGWWVYYSTIPITEEDGAASGAQVFDILSRPEWLGNAAVVQYDHTNVTKLQRYDDATATYVDIPETEYDIFLMSAKQNPLVNFNIYIIPKNRKVPFLVKRVLFDCPFSAVPTAASVKRLHISRAKINNEDQESWAWGVPLLSWIDNVFGSYAKPPYKTGQITKRVNAEDPNSNWNLGYDASLAEPLREKQDCLCFLVRSV